MFANYPFSNIKHGLSSKNALGFHPQSFFLGLKMAVDSLVDSISTYYKRQPWTHVYFAPYFIIYFAWIFYWHFVLGINEWWEIGCIISVGLIILQVFFLP